MSTLLLVGHGSRDPRSSEELGALADRVALFGPDVRLGFLELSEPLLEGVLAEVTGEVVVVPLLLGAAFHAKFDLPGRLDAVRRARADLSIVQASVLGPDPRLDAAVADRGEMLVDRGCDGIVLLGTGSSHQRANAAVVALAARATARLGVPVEAGFVTATPGLETAADALRAKGAGRIGVLPWFLAPGRLLDAGLARAATIGAETSAPTLADDPRLARLVLARAAQASGIRRAA